VLAENDITCEVTSMFYSLIILVEVRKILKAHLIDERYNNALAITFPSTLEEFCLTPKFVRQE